MMSNVIKFPQAQNQVVQRSLEEVLGELDAYTQELLAAPCPLIQEFRNLGFSEFEARKYAKQQRAQTAKSLQLQAQQQAAQKRNNVIQNKQKQKQFKTNNKAKRKAWKALQQSEKNLNKINNLHIV
jgi:hypothetical protein